MRTAMDGCLLGVIVNIFGLCMLVVDAFNLDTKIPIVKTGPEDSYFGFSVAEHQIYNEITGEVSKNVLLVGAPRDNITDTDSNVLKRITRPGVIYTCPLTSLQDDCDTVKINRDDPMSGEDRTDQWMGVTVSSQHSVEGKAVACAHRYNRRSTDSEAALGICILMTNVLDEAEYLEPCGGRPTKEAHGQYGYCQAGVSLDISQDGDVLVGTPGPFNWRGTVFKNIIRDSLTETKKWIHGPVEDPLPGTNNPPVVNDYYSYAGYASKIGKLIDGQKTYVAGAPRSRDVGQVFLFVQEKDYLAVKPNHILTGEQFGSCYGYDIAILDINGDKKEDLVVSAPFYSWTAVGGNINIGGIVYVYLNGPEGITNTTQSTNLTRKMTLAECRKIDCQNARFGMSIARIGDIDLDGYEDLAVGAPFESKGVVYIFRGSPSGFLREYSQRIAAQDLSSINSLHSFGYAISSGIDMDDNGYPDVVVGAYASTKVVLLRSRPVVNVSAVLTNYPKQIDPQVKQCPLDGRENNCFEIRLSAAFRAKPEEKFARGIEITYKLEAELFSGVKSSRVFFKGADANKPHEIERTMQLSLIKEPSDGFKAKDHAVYIYNTNTDFLQPIRFRLTYRLKPIPLPSMNPGDPLPEINNYPIINEASAVEYISVEFIKNCGIDEYCHADMSIHGEFQHLAKDPVSGHPQFKVDLKQELQLLVDVQNHGEDAHEATVTVRHPPSAKYIGLLDDSKDKSQRINYYCNPDKQPGLVECLVGNPMPKNQRVTFIIRFNMASVGASSALLNFELHANTTSVDTYETNNKVDLSLRIVVETDMIVRGFSDVSEVFYSGAIYGASAVVFEDMIGMQVIHNYEIKNAGPGRVANSTIFISWPYELASQYDQGKYVLYLLDEPLVDSSAVKCYIPSSYVNPWKIQKRQQVARKETTTSASNNDNVGGNNASETSDNSKQLRSKRDVIAAEVVGSGRATKVVTLDCESRSAKCFTFPCVITNLGEGDSVVISMRSRLWNSTFNEDYRNVDYVRIFSLARLEIDPNLNIQQTNKLNDIAQTLTIAYPAFLKSEETQIPLWIIVLAVIGGVLILIVIVILLWKCGFFKRKTPDDMYRGKVEKKKKKKTTTNDDYFSD